MGDLKKFSQPEQVNKELLARQAPRRRANRKLIAILIGLALGIAFGEIIVHHAWRLLTIE